MPATPAANTPSPLLHSSSSPPTLNCRIFSGPTEQRNISTATILPNGWKPWPRAFLAPKSNLSAAIPKCGGCTSPGISASPPGRLKRDAASSSTHSSSPTAACPTTTFDWPCRNQLSPNPHQATIKACARTDHVRAQHCCAPTCPVQNLSAFSPVIDPTQSLHPWF